MEPLAEKLFEEVRRELAAPLATPLSTYRLQLHKGFTLKDARALVPYFERLGITHLYTSPLLKAMPGSNHGYDCIDHSVLNPEIGTEEDLSDLAADLRRRGMGLVLDTVPNHMGIEKGLNALWYDVLENGPSSIYARYFDIDWEPVKDELKNKVLLPILGDQYGEVLEKGELKLGYSDGAFTIHYYDHTFPVAPREYATVLRHRLSELERQLGPDDLALMELLSIITAIEHLPIPATVDHGRVVERNREKEVIKRRLATLATSSPQVRGFIEGNVRAFNGTVGDPESFDLLDRVLSACSYRLAHWRVAGEEINYRRFFDINGLAAIRTEDRDVFDESHRTIFRWLAEGKVQGLRIDHPDGLFDPTAYFLRLQEEEFLLRIRARRPKPAGGSEQQEAEWRLVEERVRRMFWEEFERDPRSPIFSSLYVVVEKIQGGRERIPEAWAVHGTTGYRFANAITGLFVPRENEKAFTRIWERFIGRTVDFKELVYQKKKLILSASMSSEINVLAHALNRISEMNRRTRDFTLNSLRRALVEFIALFPVYRTYVDDWRPLDERDVQYVRWTVAQARRRDPTTSGSIFTFLEDILLRNYPPHVSEQEKAIMLSFTMKLQQLTGPVMAKGLEDTAFYIYNRLTALNEVGGEPERFGTSVETFHLRNQERAENWPASLLTSSTHDTKRSEDVRTRLCVLAELPDAWKELLRRWSRQNRRLKQPWRDRTAPDENDEYLYYQSLLGIWPMGPRPRGEAWTTLRDRLRDYMIKAIREAKVNTSWVSPDPAYEEAMVQFVERTLDEGNAAFLESVEAFSEKLRHPGIVNSLAATLLKLASPGTTDVYQGCELWDLSLVDPDNRRPVDYAVRQQALEEVLALAEEDREKACTKFLETMSDGRVKLYVVAEGLAIRRRNPWLVRKGSYQPLDVVGARSQHVVAFARGHEGRWAIAVAPRKVVPLLEAPGGPATDLRGTAIRLPQELDQVTLREAYTGRTFTAERRGEELVLDLGELLELFPVALLESSIS